MYLLVCIVLDFVYFDRTEAIASLCIYAFKDGNGIETIRNNPHFWPANSNFTKFTTNFTYEFYEFYFFEEANRPVKYISKLNSRTVKALIYRRPQPIRI